MGYNKNEISEKHRSKLLQIHIIFLVFLYNKENKIIKFSEKNIKVKILKIRICKMN